MSIKSQFTHYSILPFSMCSLYNLISKPIKPTDVINDPYIKTVFPTYSTLIVPDLIQNTQTDNDS